MAEAIIIWCLYVGPFIILLTVGGLIVEVFLPAIARRRARKRRYDD